MFGTLESQKCPFEDLGSIKCLDLEANFEIRISWDVPHPRQILPWKNAICLFWISWNAALDLDRPWDVTKYRTPMDSQQQDYCIVGKTRIPINLNVFTVEGIDPETVKKVRFYVKSYYGNLKRDLTNKMSLGYHCFSDSMLFFRGVQKRKASTRRKLLMLMDIAEGQGTTGLTNIKNPAWIFTHTESLYHISLQRGHPTLKTGIVSKKKNQPLGGSEFSWAKFVAPKWWRW